MLKHTQSDKQTGLPPEHSAYDFLPGRTSPGGASPGVTSHEAARPGFILLADHAGSVLPDGYGSLGLGADQFKRHIAYDIGVREVVSGLARSLGVPALFGIYSRLLIDLNRGLDDPTLIMRLSDGSVVPGNADIDEAEKSKRIAAFHQPYHGAIGELIGHVKAMGQVPVLLSVHSFTPVWKGVSRPWHASVLWDKDDRLVRPLLDQMGRDEGLNIGDNVPYSGELEGDTLNSHGTQRGIAHALIEIRQDLITDAAGQGEWADRLGGIIGDIMEDENFKAKL